MKDKKKKKKKLKKPKIRAITLGLIRDETRLFVAEGYDPIEKETFYRALGGGIDFGESSLAAVQREFQEEMQAELANLRYLGCIENIFIYNGTPGHEIVLVYQGDFADSQLYEVDEVEFVEGETQGKAVWVEISRFQSGELRLYPEAFLNYL
ncbi:NUDIX domain-containing protein [Oscillatoria sp. FACHB-1406]|uniref:NUDIX hydrolase n=1 Tax=Oscillatoria sp. FACHB-1406 TaxID=2692846 RepID=UPI001683F9D2|nr:NUDIX domain-containing protein [Oscillatoria sp. FACHB-1406]MBD2580311.1 NUDIX domain-containing protein [Oscillatoria sp. FACHB-1406]